MTNTADRPPEGDDIDLLLPWYATDRLDPADRARIAEALATDPDLARRLALAEEELGATVEAHEALPAPSGRVRQDLFARIDALERTARGNAAGDGLVARILGFFEALSPRTTAMAAGLAALLIVVQAGFLAGTLLPERATFDVASHGGATSEGSFAFVTFEPAASASQIVEALGAENARITEGPYPGGVFRVRLSTTRLDRAAFEEAVAKLTRHRGVVQLVLPAGDR
jgi:anti-sigma factor RsiW